MQGAAPAMRARPLTARAPRARSPAPALLGPYCPLFARKFSNASAPHTLHALLGLLTREQVELAGAAPRDAPAGCASDGLGLAGRRRAMAAAAADGGGDVPARGAGLGQGVESSGEPGWGRGARRAARLRQPPRRAARLVRR